MYKWVIIKNKSISSVEGAILIWCPDVLPRAYSGFNFLFRESLYLEAAIRSADKIAIKHRKDYLFDTKEQALEYIAYAKEHGLRWLGLNDCRPAMFWVDNKYL